MLDMEEYALTWLSDLPAQKVYLPVLLPHARHGVLHIKSRIQFCQTEHFFSKLRFRGKGFPSSALVASLILKIGELFMGFLQLLRMLERALSSRMIFPGISSKRYTMAYSAFQGNIKVMPETIKGKFHLKTTITAKRDWLGRFHNLLQAARIISPASSFSI